MRAMDQRTLARRACRGGGAAWLWAHPVGRWAIVGRVRLVDWRGCLLGGVGRSPLIVEAKGTRSQDDFAVDMPYIVAEVSGVEDGYVLGIWEVQAKGD